MERHYTPGAEILAVAMAVEDQVSDDKLDAEMDRQNSRCTYWEMGNHTTEVCGKRQHKDNGPNTDVTNTSRNYKRTSYHSGLSRHFKSACIHFKRARDQGNKVNKGPASASIATEGDCDLI